MAIVLPLVEEADVLAVRAVIKGEASPVQQKRAMDFLLRQVCRRTDSVWVPGPDGSRQTDFESGRQWVGVFVSNMMLESFMLDVRAGKYQPAPPAAARRPAPASVNTRKPR